MIIILFIITGERIDDIASIPWKEDAAIRMESVLNVFSINA